MVAFNNILELLRDDRYRYYIQRHLPNYMINEIDPLTRGLSKETYCAGNLTVFDIGANRGMWTAALLMHSGPNVSQVHMFEPMSGNIRWINQHMSDGIYQPFTENIVLNEVAVGSFEGDVTINFDTETTPYASIAVDTTYMGNANVHLDNQRVVPLVTIDAYCERHDIKRIDLLKVDVEGLELDVLRGASRMLSNKAIGSIIYEFGTHQMGRREFFKDFWDFFAGYGYTNYKVMTLGRLPQKIAKYTAAHENFSGVGMMMAAINEDPAP